MTLRKITCALLILCMLTTLFNLFVGCGSKSKEIATVYRTAEEWAERWTVPEYRENKEITDENYDHSLAVKCVNGTFVGQSLENGKIKTWRGIPFAKLNARFEMAVEPDKSDKVYEAFYFGKSSLQQPDDESEPASYYKMGDLDTLTLALATGNDTHKNKPVFVYVHGGAYTCGGTTDPAYDLRNLAYYYPDVIFIDITYRLGITGHINFAIKDEQGEYVFSDYEKNQGKYNVSNNLAILDVIQSLRWIKQNIAGFGGDINNVTIGGESAGAGSVSTILMMASDPENNFIYKDENLFQKVYSMSGGINQYATIDGANLLTGRLIEYYEWKYKEKPDSIKDLQEMPFEDLYEFWNGSDAPDGWKKKGNDIDAGNYLDGIVLPGSIEEVYERYSRCVADDFIVMQGATTNEYDYFKKIFDELYEEAGITHEDCCKATYKYLTEPTDFCPDLVVTPQFMADLNDYLEELKNEGFDTEEKRLNELLSDHYLQTINYYMAQKQAENGGKTFCYAFDEPYNGSYSVCKAGHAIDCYYFFGSFNGGKALGTKEQVDFSRKYQEMAVNFIRTGDPSTKDFKWEAYNKETGYVTLLNKENIQCIEGYRKNRIDLAVKMIDENKAMRAVFSWLAMFEEAKNFHGQQ